MSRPHTTRGPDSKRQLTISADLAKSVSSFLSETGKSIEVCPKGLASHLDSAGWGICTAEKYLYKIGKPNQVPCKQYKISVNIAMDEDMHRDLMALASRKKTHHAEMLRTMIQWGLDEWES